VTDPEATFPGAADVELTSRALHAIGIAEGWLFSQPVADLLELFADPAPPDDGVEWLHLNEDLPVWVTEVLNESSDHGLDVRFAESLRRTMATEQRGAHLFNFRSRDGIEYRERPQNTPGNFDTRIATIVDDKATRLGLVTPGAPKRDTYAATLVLGGVYRSPLLRARYARMLRDEGVELGRVFLLGSPRFMISEPSEAIAVEDYAQGARDEFDLMIGAASAEFGWRAGDVRMECECADPSACCPRWPLSGHPHAATTPPEYTHERSVEFVGGGDRAKAVALSAHTSRPPYRPDTSDTLSFWARHASPKSGEPILVVTTQVFVPFQYFDALRRLFLPYGLDVDVVGFDGSWGDRPLTTEYLLQETLSAIRSARRLLVDACATLITT
jgi:hypothetical protein